MNKEIPLGWACFNYKVLWCKLRITCEWIHLGSSTPYFSVLSPEMHTRKKILFRFWSRPTQSSLWSHLKKRMVYVALTMGNPQFKSPSIYGPVTWQHQLSHKFVTTKHMAWDMCFVLVQNTNQKISFFVLSMNYRFDCCFKYELQVRLLCNQHLLWKHTACLETLVYQTFLTIYGNLMQTDIVTDCEAGVVTMSLNSKP